MSPAAMSSREFREVMNHRTRISTREGSGRAILVKGTSPRQSCERRVVRMREPDVSRESTRLTVEGIRNNTC
jgi:hypothetical protein